MANLSKNVYSYISDNIVEVVLCRAWPVSEWRRCLRMPLLPGATRRMVLPIVTPVWNSPFLYGLGCRLQESAGRIVGWLSSLATVVGETHSSWRFAVGAARAGEANLVMDLHGAWIDETELSAASRPGGNPLGKSLRAHERAIVTKAPTVICQSEVMAGELKSQYPGHGTIISYECGTDTERFQPDMAARQRKRSELGLTDEILFVYCGSNHPWQMVKESLEAFQRYHAAYPLSKYLLLSPDVEEIQRLIGERRLEASAKAASVPHAEIPAYLNAADVAVLLREDISLNRVASPTKLGEYLSVGLPVVAAPVARHWAAYQVDPECFCVVDPKGRDEELVNTVGEFVARKTAARELWQARCRRVALGQLCNARNAQRLREGLLAVRGREAVGV